MANNFTEEDYEIEKDLNKYANDVFIAIKQNKDLNNYKDIISLLSETVLEDTSNKTITTAKKMCSILDISRQTLYSYVEKGIVHREKIGNVYRYSK